MCCSLLSGQWFNSSMKNINSNLLSQACPSVMSHPLRTCYPATILSLSGRGHQVMRLLTKSIDVYVTSSCLFQELGPAVGSVATCCVTRLREGRDAKKGLGCCGQVLWSQAATHIVSCKGSLDVCLRDKLASSGFKNPSCGYHQQFDILTLELVSLK